MKTVIDFLVGVVVLIVLVWTLVMGGTGALVASRRGATKTYGFILGALLGPLGWLILWLQTRDRVGTSNVGDYGQEDEPQRGPISSGNASLDLGHDI